MEEGVSLSLPRKGVLGDNHHSSVISIPFTREHVSYVGSVPFSRDHVYSGESILSDFRAANGAMISVPCTRQHVSYVGFVPFSMKHVLSGDSNLPNLRAAFGPGECFPKRSDEERCPLFPR